MDWDWLTKYVPEFYDVYETGDNLRKFETVHRFFKEEDLPALAALVARSENLRVVDLCITFFDPSDGIGALADAIARTTALRVLRLRIQHLGTEAQSKLSLGLSSNKSVRKLRYDVLGPDGFCLYPLSRILNTNTGVRELGVGGPWPNFYELKHDGGLEAFFRSVESSTSLQVLKIQWFPSLRENEDRWIEVLRTNKSLRSFEYDRFFSRGGAADVSSVVENETAMEHAYFPYMTIYLPKLAENKRTRIRRTILGVLKAVARLLTVRRTMYEPGTGSAYLSAKRRFEDAAAEQD